MPPKRSSDRSTGPKKRVKNSSASQLSQPEQPEQPEQHTPILSSSRDLGTVEESFEYRLLSQIADAAVDTAVDLSRDGTQASTPLATDASDFTDLNGRFEDRYEGLDWLDIPRYMKPLRTLKGRKSWVFAHGYRVALISEPSRTFWICQHCYQHRRVDGRQALEVTRSTTSAISHMGQNRAGHRLNRQGQSTQAILSHGQMTLRVLGESGAVVPQAIANAIGNFNVQAFRYAVVSWLIKNNHPLREIETASFREMVAYANPEAVDALWTSRTSVKSYVMRLYRELQPQVVEALSQATSKIHVSFDGWTTKGGKRGFFGVVAHYADESGVVIDLPIALPQLTGSHSGDRIGDTIARTLEEFNISHTKLGYFVLDNAYSNDRAVAHMAEQYQYAAPEQTKYLQNWRKHGPLGVLIDIINYIKTPLQYDLFASLQRSVNEQSHTHNAPILEPIKPVVTRWNSYYDAFVRAVQLSDAINLYAAHHIERTARDDAYATIHNKKKPVVPLWMRSTGLNAADWAVVTEYIKVLKPLKEATKRLEARGKQGKHGAIYEVIPIFEYVLGAYEAIVESYRDAAWSKASSYYAKLDLSPAYYTATSLHPFYRGYCARAWRDKPQWIHENEARLKQLWTEYRPTTPPNSRVRPPRSSGIDEAIAAIIGEPALDITELDELDRWRRYELPWTEQQLGEGDPVTYWLGMRLQYPHLSQMALDTITIPASSCQCERLFSELGDLLEPRRRKIGAQLLAAIQCTRSWRQAGFQPQSQHQNNLSEAELIRIYDIDDWDTDSDSD
ncbi:hypothetical protein PtrM4_078200 [Pyrenophora tritici-repentis]|uniref:HAT C-terminal dimerisation domain-containing protein n=1 Tax=Pyrenophora tritici-repentis TaxID=45151 RepID=A0A834S095_9PLEO|nr:hypothetical protein PtrM4_078200 [Pyrenophora tritici-repentis]